MEAPSSAFWKDGLITKSAPINAVRIIAHCTLLARSFSRNVEKMIAKNGDILFSSEASEMLSRSIA